MAKKAELLEKAAELKLDVTEKNTIAEIEAAIEGAAKADAKEAEVAAETEEVVAEKADAKTAKAGKRSEKALREAEEEAERLARKEAGDTSAQGDAESHAKKGPAPKVRSKLERRGKNYRKVAEKVEAGKIYNLTNALALAVETNPTKFDASVEVHVRLGVDPRQADQNIRATVALPNGTGKNIRVAVFAPEADAAKALKAGADIAGDETFTKQLEKGELNFDVLIATPAYMPKLGKFARVLGPKGLMPNPKVGTVTVDVTAAVAASKGGAVEFRVEKAGIIHAGIGKVSFDNQKLEENIKAFADAVLKAKPSAAKGEYLKRVSISSSMGVGVKVDPSTVKVVA